MSIVFSDDTFEKSRTDTSIPDVQKPAVTFEDICGQRKAKEQLRAIVESARKNHEPLGHILISGGSLHLRDMFAEAIAAQYGTQLGRQDAIKTLSAGDLAAIVTNIQEDDILYLAGIESLLSKKGFYSNDVGMLLYKAMESFYLDIVIGKGPSASSIRLDLPRFSLIGGTPSAKSIHPEALSRFDYIVELADFDYDERVAYVEYFLEINNAELDTEMIEKLALECQQEFELKSQLNLLKAQSFCRKSNKNASKLESSHLPAVMDPGQHDIELEQKAKTLHTAFAKMMEYYPKTGMMEKRAFDSLLKDFFPSMSDISFLLSILHENGILKEMRASTDALDDVTVKYAKMLIHQYAVRPSIAITATKLWENLVESSK